MKSFRSTKDADKIVGHDPRLVGWPWVDGTHSWLEPTALAILALCRAGLADHPRVNAGIELILDRALDGGRLELWEQVRFRDRAAPAARPDGARPPGPGRPGDRSAGGSRAAGLLACGRSGTSGRRSRSAGACWGCGLTSASPSEAETWLEQAYARCIGKPDAVMGLALLLLASSEPALGLMVDTCFEPGRDDRQYARTPDGKS